MTQSHERSQSRIDLLYLNMTEQRTRIAMRSTNYRYLNHDSRYIIILDVEGEHLQENTILSAITHITSLNIPINVNNYSHADRVHDIIDICKKHDGVVISPLLYSSSINPHTPIIETWIEFKSLKKINAAINALHEYASSPIYHTLSE